jgi:hypothetical protein
MGGTVMGGCLRSGEHAAKRVRQRDGFGFCHAIGAFEQGVKQLVG